MCPMFVLFMGVLYQNKIYCQAFYLKHYQEK